MPQYSLGWRTVCAEIDGAAHILAALETEFVDSMEKGEKLDKFERRLTAALAETEWSWPWLEQWEAQFRASGYWPAIWDDFDPDEDEAEDYTDLERAQFRRRAAAPLIAHTAMTTARRFYDVEMLGRLGGKGRLVLLGDAAETWAAKSFPHTFSLQDGVALPPFFPGDRTSISVVR